MARIINVNPSLKCILENSIYSYLKTSYRGSRIMKRITRLPSDYEVSEEELKEKTNINDVHTTRLINRNPRNLEQLMFEPKPFGWELEKTTRAYWNKVVIEKSVSSITARIVHNSGTTIVSASTNESAVKDKLSNLTDKNAASILGMVLAKRCLESGISYVHSEVTPETSSSLKVQSFMKAFTDGGIQLIEPPYIFPRKLRDI